MARGNSGDNSNLKLFFMKITGLKEGEKVHIKQTEATGDKTYTELDETIGFIAGKLHKVETRDYEWKGDQITELKIWLKDTLAGENGEMYAVSVGINSIGRSIINSLLSLDLQEPYNNLSISVWNKKDTGFASVQVKYNDERANWKYQPGELTEYIDEEPKKDKKGKVIGTRKVYHRLDEFLLNELKEKVLPKFNKTPSEFAGKEPNAQNEAGARSNGKKLNATDVLDPETDGSDDLPF
jgi:hypothetical protein